MDSRIESALSQSQIKASIRVNSEMLRFYWSVGKDITERQFDNKYGTHFYENLSRDLVVALNVKKDLAPTSLRYTKYFYQLYSPLFENRRQPADDLREAIYRQPAEELDLLFCIPWLTIKRLLIRYKVIAKRLCSLFVRHGRTSGAWNFG